MAEELEDTEGTEDVEGHYFDRPADGDKVADRVADAAPADAAPADRADDDVEAHIFDRPADGMADGAPADG